MIDGADERRRRPRPASGGGRPGGAPAPAIRRPADEFSHWDEITQKVLDAFVAEGRGSGGDYRAAMDDTAFFRIVDACCARNPHWNVPPAGRQRLVALLRQEFFGFGPLAPWMELPGLEEIMCNTWDCVYYIVRGEKQRMDPSPFRSEKDVRDFLNRVFATHGREINLSNPMEDATLPDGSRLHAEIPPLAVEGATFNIRKFNPQPFTMEQYLATDMFSEQFLADLKRWIWQNANIVVSGSTGSGKTTFLNAIGQLLPRDDRVIVVENTKELRIKTDDTIYKQAIIRGTSEGVGTAGAVTIRDAIRGALRQSPDRLIVGEVRSREAIDLLDAMNTGHDGSWSTIHADSAVDVVGRLEGLAMRDGTLPIESIQDMIGRAVDICVQVGRFPGSPYRKVLEAWQVLHPIQIELMRGPQLEALRAVRDAKDLRKVKERVVMFPLYQRDAAGRLVKRHDFILPPGKKTRPVPDDEASAA